MPSDTCPQASDFGEPCAVRGPHEIHMTAPNDDGMITSWGAPVLVRPVTVHCERRCGMAVVRDAQDAELRVRHNADDSHTLVQDGQERTVNVVVRPPRHLRIVHSL